LKGAELQKLLGVEVAAGARGLEKEVTSGYCGDLLSDVMANAKEGAIWVTIQSHQNIVAVAVLKRLAAIVLANSRIPDEETRAKAEAEGIPILLSALGAYQIAGRLYELGIGRIEA